MKNAVISALLCVLFAGCTSRYQQQVDQSLLLQENQRLEEALYVTHAQLVDMKRENDALKNVKTTAATNTSEPAPALRSQRYEPMNRDDFDEAPPYHAPEVIIPDEDAGSAVPPDSLNNGLVIPPWTPTRN